MCKLTSLLKIKTLSVFALTLVLGLWLGGFFERYVFYAGFVESFSKSEARALIGKRVKNACQAKQYSELTGEIIGYSEHDFSDIYIEVKWENYGSEKSGILLPTGFSKGCYKQCIKFVESE